MAKTKAEKITSIEEEIRQLENRRRQLVQEQKAQERKDRTKRLCRRMGLFESLVPDTIPLTEEQFKTFLEKTVAADHARRILDELTAQNAPTAPVQGAETAAQGNTPPAARTAHTAREGGADGSMNRGGLQGRTYIPHEMWYVRSCRRRFVPVGTKENGGSYPQKGARRVAIYHCSIKVISRGKGKSAVAAAAYRAGEKITNEFDGMTHDYTHKGGVVHTEILLPDHAPAEYADRAVLWNEVEKIEKAKNAQLAREIEIALPRELTREQGISLVREYVKRHFVAAGMCADVCLHDTGGGNPHAHIMLTMRPFDEGGEWGAKQKKEYILDRDGNKIYDPKKRQYKCKSIPATDWNEQTKAEEWRAAWARLCNQALEQNGHAERVDHRSYERQGIDQIPTVHLGVAASAMEKRGIRTERGDLNREIEVTNQKLRQLKARISKLQNWLKEETENTEPPTLADYIQGILSRKAQAGKPGYSQSLYNLKDAAKMLNFLQANNIMDMTGLDEKFKTMIGEQLDIQGKLKPVERRLATLKKHLEQADIYFKYKGKKPLTEAEQILFTTAKDYLKGVMNGKTTIPTKTWKEEYTKLTAERKTLNQRYLALKEEVKEAEKIRKSVYSILRQEQREQQPRKAQDMER